MPFRNHALISPEVIEAAMERAHALRSQAVRDGLAFFTFRPRRSPPQR